MASRDDYRIRWVCALPLEMAAAKAMLDRIHADLPAHPRVNDSNSYVQGSLNGHNVVLAYQLFGVCGTTSAAAVATQMCASFKSIRFSLMAGIRGGVPNMKEDIRLGDIVLNKPTAARPGLIQYDFEKEECVEDQFTTTGALNKPSTLLLTAEVEAEMDSILGESQIPRYISETVQKGAFTFAHSGLEQDVDRDYDHTPIEPAENRCNHCHPNGVRHRPPRGTQNPKVHCGLVVSGNQLMYQGATRDKLACENGILCFDTEAASLMNIAQCLVIWGICDYADLHKTKLWQGYAAAVAATYAKEIQLLIPTAPKLVSLAADTYAVVATVIDALLLTRPEVDRSSLIALKARRVNGTCEWLIRHPSYQE